MRHFTYVHDLGDLKAAVKEALEVKSNRFAYKHLGQDKTLMMIFFNSSLRTRLSTQKAAMNLGMNVIVFDIQADRYSAWKQLHGIHCKVSPTSSPSKNIKKPNAPK